MQVIVVRIEPFSGHPSYGTLNNNLFRGPGNARAASVASMREWSPTSWQAKPALQQPKYPDDGELARVVDQLSKLPPLVTFWEADALKAQLAEAALGKRFVLQGGDCAERLDDCDAATITS